MKVYKIIFKREELRKPNELLQEDFRKYVESIGKDYYEIVSYRNNDETTYVDFLSSLGFCMYRNRISLTKKDHVIYYSRDLNKMMLFKLKYGMDITI
jgi:hypothetical protein